MPPLLVLGLGNPLLSDDGVGLRLLEALVPHVEALGEAAEWLDGGTQGLALLGRIEGRRALLILDAVAAGGEPGDVHVLNGVEAVRMAARTAPTAHEGGAGQLLAYAELLGDLPGRVTVVGVEPENIHTGVALSAKVEAALPAALERAREELRALAAL